MNQEMFSLRCILMRFSMNSVITKKELKERITELFRKPMIRNSAMFLVGITVSIGILCFFTGEKKDRIQAEQETLATQWFNPPLFWIEDGRTAWEYYDLEQFSLVGQYEADLSKDRGVETVSVYTGQDPDLLNEPLGLLVVENRSGKVIYSDALELGGVARAGFYLGERDGEAYLLHLYLEDRYEHGEFYYSVFRLTGENRIAPIAGEIYDWALTGEYGPGTYQEQEFLSWAEAVESYLEGAVCILSRDDCTIRAKEDLVLFEKESYSRSLNERKAELQTYRGSE